MSGDDLERARAALARAPDDPEALAALVRQMSRRFAFPGEVAAARAALMGGEPEVPPSVQHAVLAGVAAQQRVALGVVGRAAEVAPEPLGPWMLAEDGTWMVGASGLWVTCVRGPRWDDRRTFQVPGGGAGWTEVVDARVDSAGRRLMLLLRLPRWRTEDGGRTRLEELDLGTGTWASARYRPDEAGDGVRILPDLEGLLGTTEAGSRIWTESLPGRAAWRRDLEDPEGRLLRLGGFSPDGVQVAVVADGGRDVPSQVLLGPVSGGPLRACGSARERGPDHVDFSACGRYLGAWRARAWNPDEEATLWVLDAATGAEVCRADLPGIGTRELWLTPGARGAVVRGRASWWLDLETGRSRLLDEEAGGPRRDRNAAGLAMVGAAPPSLEDLAAWAGGAPRRGVDPPIPTGFLVPRPVALGAGGAAVEASFPELDLRLSWDRASGATRAARVRRGRLTGAWVVRGAAQPAADDFRLRVEVEDLAGGLVGAGDVDLPPGEWDVADAAPGLGRVMVLDGARQRFGEVDVEGSRLRWVADVAGGRWVEVGYTADGRPFGVVSHKRLARLVFLDPDTGAEVERWWLPGAGQPWEPVATRPGDPHAWLVSRHKLYRAGGDPAGGVATLFGKREQEDMGVALHPAGKGLARRRRGGRLSWEEPGAPAWREWEIPEHLGFGFAFSPSGDELYVADMGFLRILPLGAPPTSGG